MANEKETKKQSAPGNLPGGTTQAQLDAWKTKYGEVHIVTVQLTDDKTITGYFKKPGRDILANCVNMSTEGKTFEAREFLANNTFIGGDSEIQTNFDAAVITQTKLWASLNFLKAEVRKY